MPRVELIYDSDCPNVAAARALLLRAFSETGLQAGWQEWQSDAEDCPAHLGRHASPTILVDNSDVEAGGGYSRSQLPSLRAARRKHGRGSHAGCCRLCRVWAALNQQPKPSEGKNDE